MVEVTVKEAARRLGVSEQRAREMVRSHGLRGRRFGRSWVVDLGSVQDRARIDLGRGRPWASSTAADAVRALSYGDRVDAKSAARLRITDADQLWRKIAQVVTIRRFSTRHTDLVRDHLALTGESAIDQIGEKLVGESRVLHGYLRDVDLEDLIDDAGLVEDGEGNVAIYELGAADRLLTGTYAPRALIAVDCARSASTRVHAAGVRALSEMKQQWLAKST